MATDVALVLENLLRFFRFDDTAMICVGAGGGQLAGYGRVARHVLAVDSDATALALLAQRIRELGIEEKFALAKKDFMAVTERSDVVLFEFCLHEMPDPGAALAHAATLAPDLGLALVVRGRRGRKGRRLVAGGCRTRGARRKGLRDRTEVRVVG
jgi:SAM-dependent methyltransferase